MGGRKARYLESFATEAAPTRLVAAADKLANTHSMLRDQAWVPDLWDRFQVGRERQIRYLRACAERLGRADDPPGLRQLVEELRRRVEELAGAEVA